MALAQATYATELETLPLSGDPVAARTEFAQAFGEYFKEAVLTGGGPLLNTAAIDSTSVPAMAAALTFSIGNTALQGATAIVTAINAFWATLVAAPATFWTGATLVTPPPYATLAATLASTFEDNRDDELGKADASNAIAGDIHLATDLLGTVTFPGPLVRSIT